MISDILSDAVYELERYLDEMPTAYATMRDRLLVLIEQMDAIRRELDGLPEEQSGSQ